MKTKGIFTLIVILFFISAFLQAQNNIENKKAQIMGFYKDHFEIGKDLWPIFNYEVELKIKDNNLVGYLSDDKKNVQINLKSGKKTKIIFYFTEHKLLGMLHWTEDKIPILVLFDKDKAIGLYYGYKFYDIPIESIPQHNPFVSRVGNEDIFKKYDELFDEKGLKSLYRIAEYIYNLPIDEF